MKRTVYRDGIEVDALDLNFTEESKIDEILRTRRSAIRYGVIRGLTCSVSGSRINIEAGEVLFKNGEIGVSNSPISNIAGASAEAGVSTFVGVRLVELMSNPKPHEIDPVVADVRAETRLSVELFVATSADSADRDKALQRAISAELYDENFILLAEVVGTGIGLDPRPVQVTPSPKSRGGVDPFRTDEKTSTQIRSLTTLYSDENYDRHPIASAEDHIHRSLIGSGIPNPKNPHGMTLSDIGGDALLDRTITQHQLLFHANGIIGFEPADDDWNPNSGSFAWRLDGIEVAVQDLVSQSTGGGQFDEVLVINGKVATRGQIQTIPDGVISSKISFSGAPAGYYYIVVRWSSDDSSPAFLRIAKSAYDALCPINNGVRTHYNNALYTTMSGKKEKAFYVIGLVNWNGSQFINIATPTLTIPGGSPSGELVFSSNLPVGHPFYIPPTATRLDLRRWGTITNEEVHKRSIRLDRLIQPVISESDFVVHSGVRIVNGNPVPVTGTGLRASPTSINDTILKHLTDLDANTLFNHRRRTGTGQHGLASHTGALDSNYIPLNEDAANAGFQSAYDKWKQDNLTMTVLKFADLKDLTDTEKGMGDAAASTGGNPLSKGAGSYFVYRRGVLKNFTGHVGRRPSGAGNKLTVNIIVRTVGSVLTGQATTAGTTVYDSNAGTQVSTEVFGILGGNPTENVSFTRPSLVIPINGTPAAPVGIQCTRTINPNNPNWRDLTITCELHYGS